jgi:hypothetical protein
VNYLRLLHLWVQLERRASGVRRTHGDSGTTLSVSCAAGPGTAASETVALSWRATDPLAVRVTLLAGAGCTGGVLAREDLRAAARSGFGRRCRVTVDGITLRPSRRSVRRLLDASDAVLPVRAEAVAVDAAADTFLTSLLGPVTH